MKAIPGLLQRYIFTAASFYSAFDAGLARQLIYSRKLRLFANIVEVDLSQAVRDKMVANARKYPVERYKEKYK